MKKIVYSLLASAIVMSQFAISVQAEEKNLTGGVFDIGYHADDPMQSGGIARYSANGISLDSRYDSREKGLVTPVKSQNPFGTCWAFSTVGTGETSAIVNQTGASASTDLSEFQFAYSFYHRTNDPLNNTAGDKNKIVSTNTDYLNVGGNAYYSAMALSQWMGLVDEVKAPYADLLNNYDSKLDENLFYNSDSYVMKNAYFLPDVTDSNIDEIKEAIVKHGAVSASYYEDELDPDKYLNTATNAFYDDEHDTKTINHGIVVVGYDDNYSRNNFKEKPDCDGAWIIKNSWGDSSRDNGYFYMSYKSPLSNIVCYDFAKRSDYKNNYFYDGNASMGYVNLQNQIYGANIFEAKDATGEELSAVSIGIGSVNTDYEVSVYRDLTDDSNPKSGKLVASAQGSTVYEGIYTVNLDKSVSLAKGDKFSIVVKLAANGREAVLYTSGNSGATGSIQFIDKTEKNQSFVSSDENYWSDLSTGSSPSTARIKAITTQSSKKSIQNVTVSGIEDKNYTGQELTQPSLIVKDGNQELTNNKDYTISYENNINAGKATIIIKGTGDYIGTVEKPFTIKPISLEQYDVTVTPSSFTYSGKANKPTVTVKNNNVALKENTDYSVSYQNNTNVGTASLTIEGCGNYFGTINESFVIEKEQLTNCHITLSADAFTYSGNENKPKVFIENNGMTLSEGTDFSVTYQDNIHVGTGKVIIQGLNNYDGTVMKTFTISEKTVVPVPGNSNNQTPSENNGNEGNQNDDSSSKDNQISVINRIKVDTTMTQLDGKQVELTDKTKQIIQSSTMNYLKKYYSQELNALPENSTIRTSVSLKAIDEKNLTKEQKNKINKALQKGENILAYYDISIRATGYDKDGNVILGLNNVAITQMDQSIQISIVIPDQLMKNHKQFGIVRLHENQATELNSSVKGNVITFDTDCFSIYALVAKNDNNAKVDTSDHTSLIVPLAMMSVSVIFIYGLYVTRKKNEE